MKKLVSILIIILLVAGLGVGAYFIFFNKQDEGLTQEEIDSMVGYTTFMDSNLYFDSDGIVIASEKDIIPDKPEVTGLDIDYVVLGEKLPVSDDGILDSLLRISTYLATTSVTWNNQNEKLINIVDRIHFDTGGDIVLYVGDIIVEIGSDYHLEEKLVEMSDILPSLEGKSGTLHLENYSDTNTNHIYTFD